MAPSAPSASPDVAVRLLDVDPGFARAIPDADRELAGRALTVRGRRVAVGHEVRCDPDEAVAVLLTGGAAWREVGVGGAVSPQLLGPGSVVLGEPSPPDLLPVSVDVRALQPVRIALLDRRFLASAGRWPQLAAILHRRIARQERDLATLAAIAQSPRVEDRLRMLFWHLAEHWGRVGPDGVHLPLRLTHATLGRFVGARRPTVSLALSTLREENVAIRQADGTWLLRGDPDEAAPATARPRPAPPLDVFVPAAPAGH